MYLAGFNWVAVLVAALAVQPIGALWYSPRLFGTLWMREVGYTPEDVRSGPTWPLFAVGFLAPLVMAGVLWWLAGATDMTGAGRGLGLGALTSVGLVVAGGAPHYAFSGRSLRLFLIDAGHTLASLLVIGAIVGAWR